MSYVLAQEQDECWEMAMTEDLIHDKGYPHDSMFPIVSHLNLVLQLAPHLICPHDLKDTENSLYS